MKKISSNIILIILLLTVVGIFAYSYLSSTFNEQSIKAIDIQFIDENAISKSNTQDYFLLSPTDKTQLSQTLATITKVDLNTQQITHQYDMSISNRWGFLRKYTVFFTDNTTVFLEDGQSNVYKVEEPSFFYSHDGFHHIYAEFFKPSLLITLNEAPIQFNIVDEYWSYKKLNGQWRTQVYDHNGDALIDNSIPISSSDDKLEVHTDKEPDKSYLKIVDVATGNIVSEEQVELNQLPFPHINGHFSYELTLDWTDETKSYVGKTVFNISVLLDLPEKFVFSKQRLIQGDMLEVSVYYVGNTEDILFEQSIYNEFQWYKQNGLIRGYIPTNYNTKPGKYQIKYGNRKKGTEFTQQIEVEAYRYRIQHLTIDEKIDEETRNDAGYEEFNKFFTPVRKQSEPDRYYTEDFIMPTQGLLTSEFGQTRYVNGAPTWSRHSGLDIASPLGTEVKATNRGKVVLTKSLILTGNTMVIDHGQGLFSVYYHMHEGLVHVGEIVERGQKIGIVGSTGFSTGPHLHFTMSYYMTNIEPGFLIVGQPITLPLQISYFN